MSEPWVCSTKVACSQKLLHLFVYKCLVQVDEGFEIFKLHKFRNIMMKNNFLNYNYINLEIFHNPVPLQNQKSCDNVKKIQ